MRDYSGFSFHWALGGKDFTGGIEQNQWELDRLMDFIDENHVKSFFEIGMAQGKLNQWMKKYGLQTYGVSPNEITGVEYIKGRSQDVFNLVGFYDMIFVDGDHSYQAVMDDFRNYIDKCRFMAFHDICGHRDCMGVFMAWREIKKMYEHIEIVSSVKPAGIGIIKI